MPFEDTHHAASREGELGLHRRPGSRAVVFVAQLLDRHRQIVGVECLRVGHRMIVMVPYVAEKDAAGGRLVKPAVFAERRGHARRPPRIEMASAAAAQSRAPPSLIFSARCLVVDPDFVHGEPLHQQGNAARQWTVAVLDELLEKVLMAENGIGRPRSDEVHIEQLRLRHLE